MRKNRAARRVRLRLNRHELRALLVLLGRVRLTPIERLDLAAAVPELKRALLAAARCHDCHDSRKSVMTAVRMSQKKPVWKRSRGVSLQLYLSPSEKRDLASIARKRNQSVAQVIRGWIRKARPSVSVPRPRWMKGKKA